MFKRQDEGVCAERCTYKCTGKHDWREYHVNSQRFGHQSSVRNADDQFYHFFFF